MERDAGRWTALLARMATEGRVDLSRLSEARLRREMEARMRLRGLSSGEEYVRLLEGNASEFGALVGALRTTRRRSPPPEWRGRVVGSQLRRWVESLPVPALAAEALPGNGRLRLLASNAPARELLGRPANALRAASEEHRWLLPDGTPCRDEDLPLHRAARQGLASRGERLLLHDDAGGDRLLVLDGVPMPPRRATLTLRLAESWEVPPAEGRPRMPGYYERVFEEGTAPMVLTSQSGLIVEANARARQVLRAHERELVGAPLGGLLADEALPAYHEAVASLAHVGRACARLTLLAQPDLDLEAQAREIRGETPLVEWVLHDVTHHAATERQRRDLTDLLLHDLRGPLATSTLGVEAAERGLEREDLSRAQRSLALTSMALRRLCRLVDSLLDLSRLEAGQPLVRTAELQPTEILLAAAAELEPALTSKQVSLDLDVPPNLPAIVADGDMLYRAVLNLLDNAVKFSPREGRVSLRATAQDRGVLICVADQGPGIPRELQSRIFDKFIGQYLPNAPRGYGLGLSLCRLAAEAHGGWLAVDSTPGQGSTFALWLPQETSVGQQ